MNSEEPNLLRKWVVYVVGGRDEIENRSSALAIAGPEEADSTWRGRIEPTVPLWSSPRWQGLLLQYGRHNRLASRRTRRISLLTISLTTAATPRPQTYSAHQMAPRPQEASDGVPEILRALRRRLSLPRPRRDSGVS